MRICMILEGCYPYVTGGVSSWMHQYIQAMPEHEFVLWVIASFEKDKGKFKYQLPENVTEVHEVFLDSALRLRANKRKVRRFSAEEMTALRELIDCGKPDWDLLFHMYNEEKVNPLSILMSEEFLNILQVICLERYPYIAFADMFHTIRSMLLPLLFLMGQEVPEADVYHSVATGYGGLLASLGAYRWKKPFILTEHGIYTREREEEIIRAKWVGPSFKQQWIQFFYMLSSLAYDRAVRVTSLFENAEKTQIDIGCDARKCCVISNGVHYDRFKDIPPKKEDGWIDIGAIVRMAPIKDIKTMISAFFELKSRVSNVRLHILGGVDDEEYAEECMEMIRQLKIPDIILPGVVNVITYMEKFDFTILTSISEGQPLSVIESFSAGRPCVTTDVGCCRELLFGSAEDTLGRAGYCCPPMSREALADAMERMCVNQAERIRMGQVAKERARRYYRHGDMMKKYRKVYEEM
ncbi:MAG: GT4 family glycosyltransferase PelF [Lachnospiraceae bacterium]|nr:GT4 family glycosyltransferase PelF [Lachnospiraceae bacterium]MDD3794662.1 GT4 family glycosyltransferase PelF [Lachnospiraceae bacterium]